MSQNKAEFHVGEMMKLIERIRQVQDNRGSGLFATELDWLEFHAKQIETKCKDCADKEAPSGSKNENT